MSEITPNQPSDAATLNRLMPNLADQQRVENSVVHAENNGDKRVRANSERRVGAHLARLTKLLQHEGVEARVWDSAVKELVIKPEDISDGYWEQQKQIARDNGLGDVHLGRHEKEELTDQLQEAQRTGLESWRDYLEMTGDQYPVWFRLYAWDGMSRLGTFDKAKGNYSKRSKGTVAPYPQLNPAALAKVYEAVKDQGGDDESVAKLVKSGNFNKLYSHMLLDQKAIVPTPEKPEDVRGEWREYTSADIQAITEAAEGTPWCIAGRSNAESYTYGGGRFLLFHLQDPETGKISPTAAASVRLDGSGRVAELSGLKGGASQYVEDALLPTIQEKVIQLPGGERYLQAFEDKQMLIQMDKKFQSDEPFTREEILFLYEAERPIKYMDTYARDPRVGQFKRDRSKHIQQLAEMEGIDMKEAELMVTSADKLETNLGRYLGQGFDANIVASKLSPKARVDFLDELTNVGAHIDLNDLYSQFKTPNAQLGVFVKLQERGADIDPDELAAKFHPRELLDNYGRLTFIGANITPDDVVEKFDDKGKLANLIELKKIGAKFDVDDLIVRTYGEAEVIGLKEGVSEIEMDNWLRGGASPELMLKMLKMAKSQDVALYGEGGMHASSAVGALKTIISAVPQSDLEQGRFIDLLYGKIRDNKDTFVGNYGGGTYNFKNDFLKNGFDVNTVAIKMGVDGSEHGGDLAKFMELGVDKQALLDGMTLGRDGRIFNGDDADYDRTYYVSKNIASLLEYGCDIQDIVKHIAKQYQLDRFDELQQYGAELDINELVGSMNPNDVLTHLTEAVKHGAKVDVNDLLDNPEVNTVWVYTINEMLALGADPQKIAAKIEPNKVGYVHGRWETYRDASRDSFRNKYPEIYELAYERVRGEVAAMAA